VPLLWVCLCTLEKQWKGQFEATLKDDSGTNHASRKKRFFVPFVSGKKEREKKTLFSSLLGF
jgi:hypothetical protein